MDGSRGHWPWSLLDESSRQVVNLKSVGHMTDPISLSSQSSFGYQASSTTVQPKDIGRPLAIADISELRNRLVEQINYLATRLANDAACPCSFTGIASPLSDPSPSNGDYTSFRQDLQRIIQGDAQGNVHEEELQHALTVHALRQLESDRGSTGPSVRYQEIFNQAIGSGQPPLQAEDAVKFALQQIVDEGLVAQSDAEKINAVTFRAAQLDSNLDALYDNRGSANDPTIAVQQIDKAFETAFATLQAIEQGEVAVTSRPLAMPSNPNSAAVALGMSSTTARDYNGFLWKPISDSDGKLVVLLPPSLTGSVASASIYQTLNDGSAVKVEDGRFAGDSHNGGRAHFRFSKPGSAYAAGVEIIATLNDGSSVSFSIANPGSRNES